jgi:eukaryotic translation initiation factor 2C
LILFFAVAEFISPHRPNLGSEGKQIMLKANHFQVVIPSNLLIHYYDVSIQPEKCPRRVNREVIDTLMRANKRFVGAKPVFDGRNNLYTRTSCRSRARRRSSK